ncbi:putative outer membrane porin, OprD family [Variovorax paradoxus B4]|uniref:Putative outer membrane porin, OprD family n=1 Tax=Variovorax paradoxus B4 TaxID=1246301 RepID=T1X8U5_VARPD|nr:OprD family outer membrane porin [Variovorax paradoxus]AGU48570.1 putative outer membrane porin, OprD family [Variovorax paradoxus B4]
MKSLARRYPAAGRFCSAAFAVLSTAAMAVEGDAQQANAGGFVQDTRWRVLNRSVYESRHYLDGDRSNGGRNAALPRRQRSDYAQEWGYGLMGSVESGFTRGPVGFGADAHAYFAQNLDGDDFRVGKIRMLPVDRQGYAQDGIARGGAAFKARVSSTVLKVGEQRTKTPIFSSSDTRLLPEAMRGWLLTSNEFDRLTLQAGRFTGSTDRNARGTGNPLVVNYLDPKSPRGDAFDFAGVTWKAAPSLSLTGYFGRLKDTWRTGYLGATYAVQLEAKRALGFDLQLYHSRDTGRALAGPIDNTTASLVTTYSHGPHRMGVGWQKVDGDTPFDYVTRGAIWLGNAAQLSDFNAPHEQSWQLRYEVDAASWGAPGLAMGAAYIRGSGIDGSRVPARGGYAWLGYGKDGRHRERDLWLRYTVRAGSAKGLALLLRYGEHRSNKAQAELDTRQIRVAVEYPIGG